jgi:hypothetical protein
MTLLASPSVRASALDLGPHRLGARTGNSAGFTVLQLLLYTAASGFILAGLTASLVSNIRSNNQLESYERLEERWGRLSNLVRIETTEAQIVLYGQSVSCANSSTSLVTLSIPYLITNPISGVQSSGTSLIHYYASGTGARTELRRCGPPYLLKGVLDHTAPSTVATIGPMTEMVISNPTTDSFIFRMNLYTHIQQLGLSRDGTASAGVESVDPG